MPEGIIKWFLSIVFIVFALQCEAQTKADTNTTAIIRTDSAQMVVPIDTAKVAIYKKTPFVPNPKKAGMYAALLPGAGQFYNRQYWKVPVLYAGVATAIYFFEYNLNKYNDYHTAYVSRVSNPSYTDKYSGIYTIDDIKTLQDNYQKLLDITVLAAGIGYMLQIMDAVVYSYLHNFDVSRDISLHMRTVPTPEGATVGFVYNFK